MAELAETKLNFLLIGLGSIGLKYKNTILQHFPQSTLYAIGSSNGFSEEQSKNIDRVFNNLNELDGHKIDIAIICSPATTHINYIQFLMERDVTLLVEKPLAASSDGLEQIIETAKAKQTKLIVGYLLRYCDALRAFRDSIITSQELGRPISIRTVCSSYLPDWRKGREFTESVSFSKEKGGGVLRELSHELDYLTWIFGNLKVKSASTSIGHIFESDAEESVDALLETKNERTPISLHLNYCSKNIERYCKVIFENGIVVVDLINHTLQVTNYKTGRDDLSKYSIGVPEAFVTQLHNIVRLAMNGTHDHTASTVTQAARVVKLIEEIEDASQ